jgi:hypothetical protein
MCDFPPHPAAAPTAANEEYFKNFLRDPDIVLSKFQEVQGDFK